MSKNPSIGVYKRNVDTRYHFVREFIKDGIFKVESVLSVENDMYIFTKKYQPGFVCETEEDFFG
jgi:hypothetical protein